MPSSYHPPTVEAIPEGTADESLERREQPSLETSLSVPPNSEKALETPPQHQSSRHADLLHNTSLRRSRSDTIRRTTSPVGEKSISPSDASAGMNVDSLENHTARSSSGAEPDRRETSFDRDKRRDSPPGSPTSMSAITNTTGLTRVTNSSGSSSGSGSTLTLGTYPGRREAERQEGDSPSKARVGTGGRSPQEKELVDVMSFLDMDYPTASQDASYRPRPEFTPHIQPAPPTRKSSNSVASSPASSFNSDVFSDPSAGQDTVISGGSPDRSIDGDARHALESTRLRGSSGPPHHRVRTPRSYGTPEMPRGNTPLPHIPPSALQTRGFVPYQGHITHLPRAEKLPMTGYELLANKLSSSYLGSSEIKPMYRRFEALNHRLLLHLQDELAELEEQLHRLDTTDTQIRRVPNCILPASRRQEAAAANELQWHKTDILGKIGFKLGQYNQVLSAFKDTQTLPGPAARDVDRYRAYLSTHAPIVDCETRFLDPEEDLVSLARPHGNAQSNFSPDDMLTPVPQTFMAFPPTPSSPTSDIGSKISAQRRQPQTQGEYDGPHSAFILPRVVAVMAAALLLPVLAFSAIPDFIARMAIISITGLFVVSVFSQVGLTAEESLFGRTSDKLIGLSIYFAVMTVVAGIL